jgi:hypothetical protein
MRPALEIDRIEWRASPAPHGGRAAEAPPPIFIQGTMMSGSKDLALVKILGVGLATEAPALKQDYIK